MTQSAFTVRNITPDELSTFDALLGATFGFDPRPEEHEVWKKRIEFDRFFAAFDGEEMAGAGGAYTLSMAVPGGDFLPVGGVTAIATKPTHRRRGALTAIMRRLHDEGRARGEAVSALWAAESVIYGRFGYGVAIEGADLAVVREYSALAMGPPPAGRLRLVDAAEAKGLLPATYARATAGIPGTVARREADWEVYFYDPEHWRDGATAYRFVIYERDGDTAGYAVYRQKEDWEHANFRNEVRINTVQAVDGEAYRALWRYLLSLDLVATFNVYNCRLREPLSLLLAAPRRLKMVRSDRIWLCLLDVAAALAARRYAAEGEVVLEVSDPFTPEAGGRFLLRGGPDGAECARTDRPAQLTLTSADLASAYLGDSRLPDLAWLGRVAGEAGDLARAHRMFQWPVAPWCSVHF